MDQLNVMVEIQIQRLGWDSFGDKSGDAGGWRGGDGYLHSAIALVGLPRRALVVLRGSLLPNHFASSL